MPGGSCDLPLSGNMRRRLLASLLGWGAIDDVGIKRLLGVVNGGRGIVNGLIEEVLQV